jgi:hypothetical protein
MMAGAQHERRDWALDVVINGIVGTPLIGEPG